MPLKLNTDPILLWDDIRGYQLSDRIWNLGEVTAQQMDMLLEQAINEGMSSVKLAKLLEQFLIPGREFPLTNTPYGTSGSFNARRLARSEITLAHSRATLDAAANNPFVDKMFYNLSGSHGETDICDDYATESDARGGFPVDECPTPIADTHPNCLCYLTQGVVPLEDAAAMIRDEVDLPDEVKQWATDDRLQEIAMQMLGLAVF